MNQLALFTDMKPDPMYSMFSTSISYWLAWYQNRRQKVFNREALRFCRRLDIPNFTKTPLIYSVSYFNLGGLGALFGGLSPPNPPWRRDYLVPSAHLLCSIASYPSCWWC